MIISDLQYLEDNQNSGALVGGWRFQPAPKFAFADSFANASAHGKQFSSVYTSTYTSANTGFWGTSSTAGSFSSSVAS